MPTQIPHFLIVACLWVQWAAVRRGRMRRHEARECGATCVGWHGALSLGAGERRATANEPPRAAPVMLLQLVVMMVVMTKRRR